MWAGMLHLVFGNAIIGVFEGFILAWAFKLRKIICVLVMIPANYFSAWVGYVFLNRIITTSLTFTLYNAWHWICAMVVVTYLMTLILEWPFVFFCFPKEQNRLKKSIRGNLLVNSLSYILLFSWYWLASGTALYTHMNVVHPSQIGFPKEGIVYYISETNTVCKLDLKSHKNQNICSLEATADDRLYPRESGFSVYNWDILDSEKTVTVSSNLSVIACLTWNDTNKISINNGVYGICGTLFNSGDVPKLGTANTSDWSFVAGDYEIEGLRGENRATKESLYFSLDTPFISWSVRNATHLPGDYVVFQFGNNQICLLETATKKITLLATGHGPVVVLPDSITNQESL